MVFEFGDFVLDDALLELRRAGHPVPLQPKVMTLLVYLVRHRDRAVPKSELVQHLWPAEVVGETSLTRAVRGARRALGDSGVSQHVIRNVRGHGYRFALPTREKNDHKPSNGRLGTATWSLPETDEPAFVGREALLATLDANLRDALAGRGRVALLVGEPGIGKTRTASELARRAREIGFEVLIGSCVEGEGAPAYWPWLNILRQCVAARDKETVRTLMGAGAEDIAEAVPGLKDWLEELRAPPAIDSTQARFRFFDSLVSFFKRLAAEKPLALVFDDLHRADPSTLLLLQFVTREVRGSRLLVVGMYRPPDARCDPRVTTLLSEIARRDPSRCMQLDRLGRTELARFLELTLLARPPDVTIDTLHELTMGNPLFWTQIVSVWQATGSGYDRLPEHIAKAKGLQEAIERRLETLSSPCRKVLSVAAVIGREFALGVLSTVVDSRPLPLLETLNEALTTKVIHATSDTLGRYHFVHGLMPDALYAQLSAPEAARLHHRVGLALEAHYGADVESHLAELAHHFLRGAAAADPERAVDYCLRATHDAVRRLAYEEATLHCDRALEALALRPPDEARTVSILAGKAEALYRSNDPVGARLIFERIAGIAERLGSVQWLVRAAWGVGKMMDEARADPTRIALLERATAAMSERDPKRPAMLACLAKALLYSDQRERCVALVNAAIASARQNQDSVALAYALSFGHNALSEPQDLEQRVAISSELMQMAAGRSDSVLLGAYATRVQDCLELADADAVDATIRAMSERAVEAREPRLKIQTEAYLAMRATVAGRFDEAEQRVHKTVALASRVNETAAYYFYATLLTAIRHRQGRRAEFAELVRAVSLSNPQLPGCRIALGWIDSLAGKRSEARAQLDRLLENDLASIRREPFALVNLSALSVLCDAVGDPEQSAVLYAALYPYAQLFVVERFGIVAHGPVAHCLGVLAAHMGQFEAVPTHFETAIALERKLGALPILAETSYEYARALLKRGSASDRKRARELCDQALEIASALGMAGVAENCKALALPPPDSAPEPRARRARSTRPRQHSSS